MKLSQTDVIAVEAARKRRADGAAQAAARVEWFIQEVSLKVSMTMSQRIHLATEFLKNKVIQNISRPVTKTVVGNKTIVTDRSRPGEFPKADTTQLMKTVFSAYAFTGEDRFDGYVGTPIGYGVKLEIAMDRSFLVRTLDEERNKIMQILSGPIR